MRRTSLLVSCMLLFPFLNARPVIHASVSPFPHGCRLLNTAQGSLLDDEKLVNTLQFSKTTALEVEEQLEVSVQTEEKIDAAREVSLSPSKGSFSLSC